MNLRDVVDRLMPETASYLAMHGYTPNERGFYKCPSPDHHDTVPSCHFVPGTHLLKCFGCSETYTIIHLANIFEGLPTHGTDFLQHTLKSLCERFNIEYTPPEMTEEEKFRYVAHRAYKDAAIALISFPMEERLSNKGWPADVCLHTYTGTVPSWTQFSEKMRKMGYTKEYLKQIDINERIFNEHTIVFTWCNVWGDPIGFAARDTRYVDNAPNPSRLDKYINTGSKSGTFDKGSHLYGLNWARGYRPLYIVEGYKDVISPYTHGLRNIVALGGNALTDRQADLLTKLGINDIVLALDCDPGGTTGTVKALETLSCRPGLNIRVLDLSGTVPDGKTPEADEFFKCRENPVAEWEKLVPENAFRWKLRHLGNGTPNEKTATDAIRLVVNEANNLRREEMIKIVSEITGYRLEALQRELDSITYAERLKVREQIELASKDLGRMLRLGTPDEIVDTVISTASQMQTMKSNFSASTHTVRETLAYLDDIRREFDTVRSELRGFKTGFHELDTALSGIPRDGRFIGIVGDPSHGKSSFVHQLIWKLIDNNPDVLVLLLTIDDNRRVVFPRLVAIDTNLRTRKILCPVELSESERPILESGWKRIRYFVSNHNLDVRDSSHGTTLEFLEAWIRHARSEHPSKKVIAFLDNFHKLDGPGGDERIKYKRASQTIHKLKTELGVTFICTMETIKTYGRQAGPDDVAETKKVLFDCDAMLHVYNFLQADPDSAHRWLKDTIRMPVLKLRFWKNKIEGHMPTLWYNLDTETSRCSEIHGYTLTVGDSIGTSNSRRRR